MKQFTVADLKAGYLAEHADGGLRVIMPISYQGKETLALVSNLSSQICQQLLDHNPFDADNPIVRVYGIPKDMNRTWLEVSKCNRDLLWEKESVVTIIIDDGKGHPKTYRLSQGDAERINDFAKRSQL